MLPDHACGFNLRLARFGVVDRDHLLRQVISEESTMVNVSTLALIMVVPALVLAGSSKIRPLDATVQMERLASKAEHAKTIHPDTVREIARLMSRPSYDCSQVGCSEQLQARNGAVRNRLVTLIANRTPRNDGAIASRRDPAPAGSEYEAREQSDGVLRKIDP
jgi:hypothetical protein